MPYIVPNVPGRLGYNGNRHILESASRQIGLDAFIW